MINLLFGVVKPLAFPLNMGDHGCLKKTAAPKCAQGIFLAVTPRIDYDHWFDSRSRNISWGLDHVLSYWDFSRICMIGRG